MPKKTNPVDGLFRRTVLKASAVAAGALAVSTSATASGDEEEENENDESDVDEPDGFEVEILSEHAPFVDDVAAAFDITYADDDYSNGDDNDEETDDVDDDVNDEEVDEDVDIDVELDDASTVIFAQATWEEGGESGWHRHPGMSIVSMAEGAIEVTMEHDCVPRTYAAGDAWLDPGHVHKADSEEGALAYVCFLGIPDGEPATEWVEPVEC